MTAQVAKSGMFTPVRKLRTHEEVVAQIEGYIIDGRLRPGDRLPGERQLAEDFSVSRASIREALRVLESMHVLRIRTGTGADAGAVVTDQAGSAMSSLLRLN